MSDDSKIEADRNQDFTKGPASQTVLSMSQALLAPLDAILKAQLHAARSFLNLLFQLGYPHQPATGNAGKKEDASSGNGEPPPDGIPYQMDFFHDLPGGGRQRISVPTLALVPVAPLGVSSAKFGFDFYVRQIALHRQIQASENDKTATEREAQASRAGADPASAAPPTDRFTRPWYLVDTPVSIQGSFAPGKAEGENQSSRLDESRFRVSVKVAAMPMPAALEKVLAGLGQVAAVEDVPRPGAPVTIRS